MRKWMSIVEAANTAEYSQFHHGDHRRIEWIEFQRSKGNTFDVQHGNPAVQTLKDKLAPMGGFGALIYEDDPDLNEIISDAKVWNLPVVQLAEPIANSCHETSAQYAKDNPEAQFVTGYCLTDDGLWRSHSFVVENGRIIETTTSLRSLYYGVAI